MALPGFTVSANQISVSVMRRIQLRKIALLKRLSLLALSVKGGQQMARKKKTDFDLWLAELLADADMSENIANSLTRMAAIDDQEAEKWRF